MDIGSETRNLVLLVCDMKQHGDVPPAMCSPQCSIIGVKLYCFGGANEVQSFNSMYIFEIAKERWSIAETRGLSRPSARYGHSMNVCEDKLIIFGGMEQAEDEVSQITTPIYIPPPCVHRPSKNDPVRLWYHIGQPSNSLFVFDTINSSWTSPDTIGMTPAPRAFHATAMMSSPDQAPQLFLHGGCSGKNFSQIFDDAHLLNMIDMVWTRVECSSLPRFGHKISWVPNKRALYLFGAERDAHEFGSLYKGSFSSSLHNSGKCSIDWVEEPTLGTKPMSRSFHSMAHINQSLYIISGLTAVDRFANDYVYDLNTKRWSKPLYEHELCLSAAGDAVMIDKILLFGGSQSIGQRTIALSEYEKAKQSLVGRSIPLTSYETKLSRHLSFCSVLQLRNLMSNAYKFKLVAVGDAGVGKSCLLQRFTQDVYNDRNASTIGVDFLSVPTMVAGKLVTLQLWDTAGQERFSGVIGNYYRSANGFVIVFDVTKRSSFSHVTSWIQQIKEHHEFDHDSVKLLVGNKKDLADSIQVSDNEAQTLADQFGGIYLATSAKTGDGVDSAFLLAARHLVEIKKKIDDSKKLKNTTQISLSSRDQDNSANSKLFNCC